MIHLKIDNIEISIAEGTSVLEAAKTVGITIPSMCFYNAGFDNHPSCMVCLVKEKRTGQFHPSCALKVAEGMDILCNDPDVKEARKEALELLLSDHVGDCEAPCSLACPANMNIPVMNRLIAAKNFDESLKIVKEEIALPYILGYICPAPCEKACRRKQIDESVSICLLKRFVAENGNPSFHSELPPQTGKKVAIIGAGPAGLASAFYLLQFGHQVVIFDKNDNTGGTLRYSIPENELPKSVLDKEVDIIRSAGAEFRLNALITSQIFESEIKGKFDAVIIATGDIAVSNHLEALFQQSKNGISVEEGTFAASEPGIFACGSVVRSQKMAVRAVAQGKAAAISADLYLKEVEPRKSVKRFNSRFDKLLISEYSEYLKESVPDKRLEPAKGLIDGFSIDEAVHEAMRCTHCDCRKPETCKLRIFADEYKADRRKYLMGDRKPMLKHFQHELVVYEPEKCIKCGLCIEITTKNNELTGLTYVGRGFDVRIDIPFDQNLRVAITHTAVKCVEACPTGALALKI
jgi:ferredoxin